MSPPPLPVDPHAAMALIADVLAKALERIETGRTADAALGLHNLLFAVVTWLDQNEIEPAVPCDD